jgi:sulfopyruvate decarboxylase alpha subunit
VSAEQLLAQLRASGVTIAATLPDQWLSDILAGLDAEPSITHIGLTREEEGVGICVGASLTDKRAVLICQNAGLLLAMNALSAATHHHRSPAVIIAIQRGIAGDVYPYQAYKGLVTEPVLHAAGIPTLTMRTPDDLHLIEEAFVRAEAGRTPVVVLTERPAIQGDTP